MELRIVALIPARYDSSRFPGKMTAPLGGKPVIVHTYNSVVSTGLFDDVFVVCDGDKIAETLQKHGCKYIRSIREHETGSDRIAEAAENIDCDVVVNVQGDTPFVSREPLEKLIEVFRKDDIKQINLATIVQRLTSPELVADPNYVKVVCDNNWNALYFSRCPIPYLRDEADLHSAKYFEHVGVYAYRRDSLLWFASAGQTPAEKAEKVECLRFLEHGKRIKIVECSYVSIEIDTPEDLKKAQVFIDGK